MEISQELALSRIEKIKALLFDLDGTLFDSKYIAIHIIMEKPSDMFITWAERRTRKRLAGCDLGSPEAYYEKYFQIMSQLTGNHNVASLRSWYFNEYMPRFYHVLENKYHARPGVSDLFDALINASIKIAVYSDYPNVRQRLTALKLRPQQFGTCLYGPEDFGAQKPCPRPFLTIADELGVTPASVLVVGDRDDTDGDGAHAAGMSYIRITSHKKPSRPEYPSLSWKAFFSLTMETLERASLPYAL
jgi:HAD superfamily hydrolase (TIGR01549 family)